MAERGRARSGSPYEARYGFSRAVRAGDRVLVSGTAPVWPDGACDPDPALQARRCCEVIVGALEELGASAADVVRTRMFVTDPGLADAVADRAPAQHAGGEEEAAGADHHGLEAGQRRDRVAVVLARVRNRDGQEAESHGREAEAEPLALGEPMAEVTGRRIGDQDEAAGDHALNQGERSDGHRGDVQDPGDGRDGEADRPPARREEGQHAAERRLDVDLRRLTGAAVLAEHPQVRHCGATECKCDA